MSEQTTAPTPDELFTQNQRLVYHIVNLISRRCRTRSYEDRVQAGMIGLMRAAQHYDPSRGRFSTYAWHCIRAAVYDSIRGGEERVIRVSHRAATQLPEDHPAIRPVRRCNHTTPPDCRETLPIDSAILNERRERVESVLRTLPDREERVIRATYFEGKTIREISDSEGCSAKNVWRLLDQARKRLAASSLASLVQP